jgi:DNA-binding transcriptional MerR regulator
VPFMSDQPRTVSQVARLAHVTVRTLHHYDEIGLLVPSDRSRAGYRLYSDDDLARLQQILVFRELGFTLEAIAPLLDEPLPDRRAALRAQRDRLLVEQQHTAAVIRAVDAALAALEGDHMTTDKMFEGFEEFDHAQYEDEVRERWGDTDAYKESARRTKSYGKAEWDAMKTEASASLSAFAALLAAGADPAAADAMDAAELARLHIDRWFYPCSHAMHAMLAEGYVTDPRFTAFYEKIAPGLAAFVSAAIKANAARASRDRDRDRDQ